MDNDKEFLKELLKDTLGLVMILGMGWVGFILVAIFQS